MRLAKFIAKRLISLVPLLIGISLVTFFLMHLLPQNPVILRLGVNATPEAIQQLTQEMGLDQPLWKQYIDYFLAAIGGDLGVSWRTSNPVTADLMSRFPATLTLITLSMILALLFAIPAGIAVALKPKSLLEKGSKWYALVAGAIPDFWMGLLLIYFFYFKLKIAPPPIGQIDILLSPPARLTGSYFVDSLITGNWPVFISSVKHLALPVFTLAFVSAGAFFKMTVSSMREVLDSDFIHHAKAVGLKKGVLRRYAFRNAMPPVITLIGVQWTYLLGGAVLVEQVFGWGGLGQYAVESILATDYAAIQGFVLVAATFSLLVYLLVDIIYFITDPRIKY